LLKKLILNFIKVIEFLTSNKTYNGNSIQGFFIYMLSTFDGFVIAIITIIYWSYALLVYIDVIPRHEKIEPVALIGASLIIFFGLFLSRSARGFSNDFFGIIYRLIYLFSILYMAYLPLKDIF